jgi:UDP-N-acetyl-alpha-D-muramoyl-L-alanyl-L-glutamate epimerase
MLLDMEDSIFRFISYALNEQTGEISLKYQLDDIEFFEHLTVPVDGIDFNTVNRQALDNALFSLHLMGGVSYWKTKCSKKIVVESGVLCQEQAMFWNEIYTQGLGEFFYENKIDFRGLVQFPFTKGCIKPSVEGDQSTKRDVLLPIGGGKDSIVTAESLKTMKVPFSLFVVKDAAPIRQVGDKIGGDRIVVSREISKTLIELNKNPDIYNGHVPITAYLSFLSLVVAILYKKTDVVFSLERSANEGNLSYLGVEINHQYSKSLEFEIRLQEYVKEFVSNQVSIFSLIRPLSEFHIVKLFTEYPEHFSLFSSCNRNFTFENTSIGKKTFWCQTCPKCAFIFVMLCAWLPHKTVVSIVGADLFENEELKDLFRALLGIEGNKPFECVGEAKEVAAAFELCNQRGDALDSVMMKLYVREARPSFTDSDAVIEELLQPSTEHVVPDFFKPIFDTWR